MISIIIHVILHLVTLIFNFREAKAASDILKEPENELPFDELTWIAMIFAATDINTDGDIEQVLEPICFGLIITSADVLTSCSCLKVATRKTVTSYLLVKPKSSIVWWDDDYRSVAQTHTHPHCERCSNTSYNDLAILTVDIIDTIYGVVEKLKQAAFIPHKVGANPYSECFITNMMTGLNTPRLGSLKLEKLRFYVWNSPSPKNDLGIKAIFGHSSHRGFSTFGETRYPGSPLLCMQGGEFVPIGLYLGLYCPESFSKRDIDANCDTTTPDCGDCLPLNLKYVLQPLICGRRESFEIVLTFDSLYKWVDDNTFEPQQQLSQNEWHPGHSSNLSPLLTVVFISIAYLLIVS